MPARPVVVVTRRLPEACERAAAERFDARLNRSDEPLGPEGLREALRSADGLLTTVTDRLDAGVLAAEPLRARIVANFGVGVDNIDLGAAARRGLRVTNTPDVLTDDTADLAILLMLMAARRAGEGERLVRAGGWEGWRPTHMLGTRVTGATLGVIGFGRIGRAVAARAARGFGMRVLVHTRRPPAPEEAAALGVEPVPLADLLERSDVVSLHCPSTPETRHLIDAGALARMRPGAILVNTARGDVVDEAALAEALRAGAIAGAGLDVHEREPHVPEELRAMENVVLLPHLGSATRQSREAMGMRAIENLTRFFAGEPLRDPVV